MKKLIVAAIYLLISGFGVLVMAGSLTGFFKGSGVATEIAMLSLGFLISCFSIATIPLALDALTENDK